MFFKTLTALTLASAAGLALTLDASANSRFTVQNDSDEKVNVYIYTGGDDLCSVQEKLKSVSAGKTDSFGCTGDGKNRCQVQFYANGSQVCKKQNNSCFKDNARKMKNGAKAVIANDGDGDFVCTFF